MNTVYNEIKEFLKDPIKNREAFFNNSSIIWIDWREYDEDVINCFNEKIENKITVNFENNGGKG